MRMPLASAAGMHGGEGGLDDLGEVQPLDVEAEVARDDAGDVEQVFDELGLDLGVPLDGREPFLQVLGVDLAGAEDLGPAEDGVERRAQLVREGGQEFVLHAVGRLGLGWPLGGEQPLPLLLGPLPLGDVPGDFRGPDDLAVGVADRRDAERHVDDASVLGAAAWSRSGPPARRVGYAPGSRMMSSTVLGRHQDGDVPADDLVGGVAEDPLGGLGSSS